MSSRTHKRTRKPTNRVFAAGAVHARRRNRRAWRYFLLDGDSLLTARFKQGKIYDLEDARAWKNIFDAASSESTWISTSAEKTAELLRAASAFLTSHRRTRYVLGDLLMLQPPRAESVPALHVFFRRVAGQVEAFKWLPSDELAEVLLAPPDESRDLFIGGSYDPDSQTLTLTRGDLEPLVVPVSLFRPSGTAQPDPRRLAITEYGHTIQLGDYEAAADAILYDVDPDYRRRLRARRRQEDTGFGASLRRLRIQRRLKRTDFRGLSPKTIARIERGETDKPHGRTLTRLARTLGVEPEDIEDW
jgi:DNA-binding Xre family transcriptional regulator